MQTNEDAAPAAAPLDLIRRSLGKREGFNTFDGNDVELVKAAANILAEDWIILQHLESKKSTHPSPQPAVTAVVNQTSSNLSDKAACASSVSDKPAMTAGAVDALDEHAEFERVFPIPEQCVRCGDNYAATGYSSWTAHKHCERWAGWKARAALAAQRGGAK